MPRVTNAPASRRRRKRMLEQAKGYFGNKSKLFRYATEAVAHAYQYAYRARRAKKRDWRSLWIARINIASRANGITYSRLVEGLAAAGIEINRKVLADIAVRDEAGFTALVDKAREALKAKAATPKAEAQDFTRIEGFEGRVSELLLASDIRTYAQLASTPVERLKAILTSGGLRYHAIDPSSWPEQAALADKGDWTALNKLKGEVRGGHRV